MDDDMSLVATTSVTVSGATTLTVFSGGGTLIGIQVSPFSGVATLSGAVITALDAISGITAATSGRVVYQYVGGTQSGATVTQPPSLAFEAGCSSGLVVTAAASTYVLVSYSK